MTVISQLVHAIAIACSYYPSTGENCDARVEIHSGLWLHFAVVQIAYDTFCVCLKHVFTETYVLLKEDVFCADLTDQVFVYFHVAYLRRRVFKKVIYGMRKNS